MHCSVCNSSQFYHSNVLWAALIQTWQLKADEDSPPSYHGNSGKIEQDMLVHTEFGADAWKTVLLAGFDHCQIVAYEYPAALALWARKANAT